MKKLILALVLLLSGCRNSKGPLIEVCILNPGGGANCTEVDGSHVFKLPSELKNYWATNQSDMVKFASWCNDATPEETQAAMKLIKAQNK